MKIRNGFVSNSSSSSFCIYGKSIEITDVAKLLDYYGVDYDDEHFEEDSDLYDNGEKIYDVISNLENKLSEDPQSKHMWILFYQDGAQFFLGREYRTLKDDETGGMFKDSVNTFFENHLGSGSSKSCYFDVFEIST